jgi:thiamine-monophosphate kinase
MKRPPEDALTARIARLASRRGRPRVGIGDDAAVVDLPGGPHVFTTDTLVEGIDFVRGERPFWMGRRAAAANLSDLAAMGARPVGFLLTLGLSPRHGPADALQMARGAISKMEPCGAAIWGGDLTRTAQTFVTICAVGSAKRPVLRSGARPGDLVFLTGAVGSARAGLQSRRRRVGRRPNRVELAFLDPPPRVDFAVRLAENGLASAMIDVSDGVGMDAGRLASASGVEIEIGDLDLARFRASADDFELLFTAAPSREAAVRRLARATQTPLTRVGRARAGSGAWWTDGRRRLPVTGLGYDHLRR